MSAASPAARTMLGFFVAMAVGLVVWVLCSERKCVPVLGTSVSPSGAEVKAQSLATNGEKPESVSAMEASSDAQEPPKPKLTDFENAAITARMAEVRRLLNALDATNAKLEMDHLSNSRHIVAVRIEAPTVEQLAPIYDFLSRASKDFSQGSEAEAEFRKQAVAFLWEIGSSDFRVVVKSTDNVTGVADFRSIRARVRSVAVKYRDGSIEITGPHTTTVFENPPSELPNLFPEP